MNHLRIAAFGLSFLVMACTGARKTDSAKEAARIQYELGVMHYMKGEYAEAETRANNSLQIDPGNKDAEELKVKLKGRPGTNP